jgi:hypothetical protein
MKLPVAFLLLSALTSTSVAQNAVKVSPQFIGFGTHVRGDSVYSAYVDVTSDQDVATYVHMGTGRYGDSVQQEPWCAFEPLNYPLAPRATQRVLVTIHLRDSSGLKFQQYFPVHTYADGVTRDESFLVIQVQAQSLNVRPRHLRIVPDSVNFGTIRHDQTVIRTFTFYSQDSASIAFDHEPPGYEYFVTDSDPTNPIIDSAVVTVRFQPIGYGERLSTIAVVGNTNPESLSVALRTHVDSALSVTDDLSQNGFSVRFRTASELTVTVPHAASITINDVLGEQIYSGEIAAGEQNIRLPHSCAYCFIRIDCGGRHLYKIAR